MDEPIVEFRISPDEHERFARVSGDRNPVHVDPVRARRGLFGEVIVHGVHALLRALDVCARERMPATGAPVELERLEVAFPSPTVPGEELGIQESGDGPGPRISLQVVAGDAVRVRTSFETTPVDRHTGPGLGRLDASVRSEPRELSLEEMEGNAGSVSVAGDPEEIEDLFPDATRTFGLRTVAEILAMSRLVGMRCPGLRSALSAIELSRVDAVSPSTDDSLQYRVQSVDHRFSRLQLEVSSRTLAGTITAFSPPERQEQRTMDEVLGMVDDGEFAGQCALVAGGSRGLGEATAKIVGAGGGTVVLTYYRGREDAERVADEIRGTGAACHTCRYSSEDPADLVQSLSELGARPTHLYYFPSPPIARRDSDTGFQPEGFQRYADVYVRGFVDLLNTLGRSATDGVLSVFYPSTVVLDEPDEELGEYAAAKAAGESACQHFDLHDDRFSVLVERLPRVATDQTLTIMPRPASDPIEVMLPVVRRLG